MSLRFGFDISFPSFEISSSRKKKKEEHCLYSKRNNFSFSPRNGKWKENCGVYLYFKRKTGFSVVIIVDVSRDKKKKETANKNLKQMLIDSHFLRHITHPFFLLGISSMFWFCNKIFKQHFFSIVLSVECACWILICAEYEPYIVKLCLSKRTNKNLSNKRRKITETYDSKIARHFAQPYGKWSTKNAMTIKSNS